MLPALRFGIKRFSCVEGKRPSTSQLQHNNGSTTRIKAPVTASDHSGVAYLDLDFFLRNTNSRSLQRQHTALVQQSCGANGQHNKWLDCRNSTVSLVGCNANYIFCNSHDYSICSVCPRGLVYPLLHAPPKGVLSRRRILSYVSRSHFQTKMFNTSQLRRNSTWLWVIGNVCAVTLLVIVVPLMFYLYSIPLPAQVKDPWPFLVIEAISILGLYAARIMTLCGFRSFHQNIRSIFALCIFAASTFDDIKVSRDVLAGVPVIVYRPTSLGDQPAPAVVFFHGGGFVVGSADDYESTCCSIAHGAQAVVVSVDYRLAPEHPFPAAPEDCLKVTRHVLKHGLDLGVDVTKVGVAGTSAGGNLAAVVALQLSKDNTELSTSSRENTQLPQSTTSEHSRLPPLKFQVLYYPLLQAVDFSTPSHINNNDATSCLVKRDFIGYVLSLYFGMNDTDAFEAGREIGSNKHIPEDVRNAVVSKYIRTDLLPEEFRGYHSENKFLDMPIDLALYSKIKHILTNPLFCPLVEDDVSHAPPTFIVTAEIDIFLDDGLMYLEKLKRNGVRAQGRVSRGGFHSDGFGLGLDSLKTESGKEAVGMSYEFIRREFEA